MSDKKILILYYSYDGNSEWIAKLLKEYLNAETIKLKLAKDFNHKGFMKYFWGGKMVALKEKPKIEKINKDFSEYDLIILGTPVWNFNMTPPLRSLLTRYNFKGKKLAFYCCYSGKAGKTFSDMTKLSKGQVISTRAFKDPLKQNIDVVKISVKQWVAKLLESK